jgi:hypothetical protein
MLVLYPFQAKEKRNIKIWAHRIRLEAALAVVSLAVLTCLALLINQELYSGTSVKEKRKAVGYF